ncbi:hypothetical protein [Halalkalicoccus sp. NIPERK01]|uniref:hypothetical protein n=1 Tax=Halalkalicoccus sp. NIPERK01 TaxID=3053469 RepID=UPI00256ECF6E|nr:hypothetical protein [Halalkalicoccus sp. NIPERK01]MDL5360894.1 hypothetical protein [Halalkalicoccus sp. NIPERK01]
MSEQESAGDARDEPRAEGSTTAFFARVIVRLGLVVLGTVLLLFALGRAFGLDLLGAVADFLATETGRWLAVAFLALVLISVAASGWRYRRPPA